MALTRQVLARRLRSAREVLGMTQKEVAQQLGLSQSAVARIESGRRAVTSLELERLAYLYGRDIRAFLVDQFDPNSGIAVLLRQLVDPDAR